ncbi:hypothetical protein ACA910_010977 [Epithemia clementina (nom. ined.)]
MDSKSQRNGVQDELKRLREQHLAKNQRDKLKELSMAPLTTPEEAQAFLATMREAQHKRERLHQPPSNLSADGMDAWFLRQRKEEQELRNRRREAEAILRNYRGGNSTATPNTITNNNARNNSLDSMKSSGARTSSGTTTDTPVDPNDDVTDHTEGTASESAYDLVVAVVQKNGAPPPPESPKATIMDHDQEEKKDSYEPVVSSQGTPYTGRTPRNADSDFALDHSTTKDTPQRTTMMMETAAVEETVWREFVSSEPGAPFPPEAGRYHLYCSYACPGSHRALIVRALKGLQHVISVTYVHPVWRLTRPDDPNDKHRGWVFGRPGGNPFANTIHKGGPFPAAYADNEPDPHHPDAFSIRDLYELAHDTSGKYTIPLLWDTVQNTIVNNESSDIAYMFNSCFNNLALYPDVDLYTEDSAVERAKLAQVSDWLSPLMIHGVYRCGFAKSQWAYDRAINDLCAAFDRADDILERQRYLTGSGDVLTDVDIRLFVTLLRFDEVYTVYFKANARLVLLTPSLLNFCRDIYQLPGVAATCNMEQIKAHFFASHAEWNKYSVIPRGLGFMELLDMPHDRQGMNNMTLSSPPKLLLEAAEGETPEQEPQPDKQQRSLPPSTTGMSTAMTTVSPSTTATTHHHRNNTSNSPNSLEQPHHQQNAFPNNDAFHGHPTNGGDHHNHHHNHHINNDQEEYYDDEDEDGNNSYNNNNTNNNPFMVVDSTKHGTQFPHMNSNTTNYGRASPSSSSYSSSSNHHHPFPPQQQQQQQQQQQPHHRKQSSEGDSKPLLMMIQGLAHS